ncbi:hypothetical protein U9M48_032107 [Paspalum notatum var. saurae]|uniref:Reverse transcriptase n=1 Tax=Paspalum notatum var. saurae TaxID=547442 RepID=A0AAQ3U8P9_PASNO
MSVCMPKYQGGLGILDLDNKCLLGKWLFKLTNEDDFGRHLARGVSFKISIPSLFNNVRKQHATIAEVLGSNALNVSFRRSLVGNKLRDWENLVATFCLSTWKRVTMSLSGYYIKVETFRGTYWLRQWAILQRSEECKHGLLQACRNLETVAMQLFSSFGWPHQSAVMFSPNTYSNVKEEMMRVLQIEKEMMNERYLGLPVYVGREKNMVFQFLKEKIWQRIQGWKEKLLSKAGKEILIKAVAQAIPTYAMGRFDITKGVCEQISSMICRYWWSNQDKDRKMH